MRSVDGSYRAWRSTAGLMAVLAATMIACGENPATPPGPPGGGGTPVATRMTVTPPTIAFTAVGQTGQISAVPTDAQGNLVAGQTVTFMSTAGGVATVTSTGLVTASGPGTAYVRITSGALRDSVLVTVAPPAPQVHSVLLSTHALTSDALGDTLRVSATARDASGALLAVPITYQALDPAVAMVGPSGNVWTTGPGTGRIVAQAGTAADTALVTVQQVAVAVQLQPTAVTLPTVGQTATLTAKALDRNGAPITGASITWTSSTPATATVSASGVVTAVANGTTTVRATTTGASGASVSATTAVQVTAPIPVARVAFVTATATTTAIGDTVRVTARALDANGAVLSAPITYTATPQLYGSVDATGLVTSRFVGRLVVYATASGKTDSAIVTMTQVPARVIANRAKDSVAVGDSVAPVFYAYDSRSTLIPNAVTLTSSDPTVARLSGARVVGVRSGTVTITGTAGTVSASMTLLVKNTITLSALRNAVPGETATLVGRGLLNVTTLRIDGQTLTPLNTTDTTLTVALPATCDADGRLVGVSASGNGASATASFPMHVATDWTLGVGESRVITPAQMSCVALPKGAARYRLSVVSLDRTLDPATSSWITRTLFSYRTIVNSTPVFATMASGGAPLLSRAPLPMSVTPSPRAQASASQLLARTRLARAALQRGGSGDLANDLADHRRPAPARAGLRVDATTTAPFGTMRARLTRGRTPSGASLSRIATPGSARQGTLPGSTTAFDPLMATGVVGDTVLVPDWFSSSSSQVRMCTQPKDSVPTYKAVIYAISGNAVALLDTRLAVATTYFASTSVQATITTGLGMVERTAIPAIQSVTVPGYAHPQGAGGRYFVFITPLPMSAAGTIFFAEGIPRDVCPNASDVDIAVLYPGAWNMNAGQFAGVVAHELGHVSDQRYAWTIGRATGLWGSQLASQYWMTEALASSVQEQAGRIGANRYLQEDWLSVGTSQPTPQWGIWPDPGHWNVSPWGTTTTNANPMGPYDLGSQIYTYARQLAGEGGSATPLTQTLYQRLATGTDWSVDGIGAQVGLTGDAFLDQATLAVMMDDAVPSAAAAQYNLPQFAYYTNATLQASMETMTAQMSPDHAWSATTATSGTMTVAPGAYSFYVLPTVPTAGMSVVLTPSSGAPASVVRLTRVQ